jgi:hypothetical protein
MYYLCYEVLFVRRKVCVVFLDTLQWWHMRATPDEKYEALYLLDPHAPRTMSAGEVKEALGLRQDIRTIQRWARKAYGRVPTRRELMRRNPQREELVRQVESQGLDRRYCSPGQHASYWPCLLRRLTAGGHVFVCRKHARRGDF